MVRAATAPLSETDRHPIRSSIVWGESAIPVGMRSPVDSGSVAGLSALRDTHATTACGGIAFPGFSRLSQPVGPSDICWWIPQTTTEGGGWCTPLPLGQSVRPVPTASVCPQPLPQPPVKSLFKPCDAIQACSVCWGGSAGRQVGRLAFHLHRIRQDWVPPAAVAVYSIGCIQSAAFCSFPPSQPAPPKQLLFGGRPTTRQ